MISKLIRDKRENIVILTFEIGFYEQKLGGTKEIKCCNFNFWDWFQILGCYMELNSQYCTMTFTSWMIK